MKNKLLYIIIASMGFTIASCSNDENSDDTTLILPKTITYKDQNNNIYETTTFTYDGNKIVSISNSDLYIEFTYDGNRIVKEIQSRDYGESHTEKLYSYSNDKLHKVNIFYPQSEREYIYTYNNDTITRQLHEGDNKIALDGNAEDIFIVVNGNIVKSRYNWGNGYNVISNSYYEFDTKNNAFKNVMGLNLIIDQFNLGDKIGPPSANNMTRYKVHYIQDSKATIVFEPSEYVMKYEYNSEGYPIKKTTYDYADQIVEIIEYTY